MSNLKDASLKMKSLIKTIAERSFPELYHAIQSRCFHSYCRKKHGPLQSRFRERLYGKSDVVVLSGPFEGMHYLDEVVWGPITPKWLGTYEQEVSSLVDPSAYDRIIDVGAAEGYYAVGFAWKAPKTDVFSFDVDPLARSAQRRLAELNRVKNLQIGNFAAKLPSPNCLHRERFCSVTSKVAKYLF